MVVSVDWPTRIITIPRADLTLVSPGVYSYDLDRFRLELKAEEDSDGMPFPTTHNHVQPISIGAVLLARVVKLINNYTVTFEDGQYAVNLIGANSNVADVTNVNQVSVRPNNSVGLAQVNSGPLTPEQNTILTTLGGMTELGPNGTSQQFNKEALWLVLRQLVANEARNLTANTFQKTVPTQGGPYPEPSGTVVLNKTVTGDIDADQLGLTDA